MTMTSGQCDELRDWACELRKLANGPVNEGFPARAKLFESADAMCQAADTIWELSCKLAGVVDQSDEIERLKDENIKLRELVRKYSEYTSQDHCDGCFCKPRCNDGDVDECWQLTEIRRLARELGIEA